VTELAIPALVFFLMFVVGSGLSGADFKRILQYPKLVFVATAGQILLLPFIAILLIYILEPSATVASGMLLVSLCPGGAVSNFYTYFARANTALSVTLTALSSLLAIAVLPLLAIFFFTAFLEPGVEISDLASRLVLQLLLLLLLPLCLGMALRKIKPWFIQKHGKTLERLAAAGLILLVLVILIQHRHLIMSHISSLLLTALLFTFLAIAVAAILSRMLSLNRFDSTAIMIEFPVRNLALSAVIAISIFGKSDYLVFAAIIFVIQVPIIAVILLWHRYNCRDSSA